MHSKHCEYSTSEPQFQKTVLNADCKDFLCTSNLVHKFNKYVFEKLKIPLIQHEFQP